MKHLNKKVHIFLLFAFSLCQAQVSLVEAFPQLSFSRPLDLQFAPQKFFTEKAGNDCPIA